MSAPMMMLINGIAYDSAKVSSVRPWPTKEYADHLIVSIDVPGDTGRKVAELVELRKGETPGDGIASLLARINAARGGDPNA